MKYLLQPAALKAASASGTALTFGGAGLAAIRTMRSLIFTLDVTVAERDSADETYDIYVTTGDGVASWDIVHFPQIATTGAKRFTAIVNLDARPSNVTTATPGVEAITSATLLISSTHAIKTLGAGLVRHGAIGEVLNSELVVVGTVATGINYSLTVEGR